MQYLSGQYRLPLDETAERMPASWATSDGYDGYTGSHVCIVDFDYFPFTATITSIRDIARPEPTGAMWYYLSYKSRVQIMPTITASDARKSLFPLLGQVNDDHSAVTITSKAGNGVLVSEEDYEAWQTTLYLFSTPANARRLSDAIERSARGEHESHELDRS